MNLNNYERGFRLRINEDVWQFKLITEEEAEELDLELHDSDDSFRALTLTHDKCIFVVEGNVTKNIIQHELFHLFVSYFRLGSSNTTIDDFEEIVAEWIEMDLEKFIRIRNKIYNRYKKLEGSK